MMSLPRNLLGFILPIRLGSVAPRGGRIPWCKCWGPCMTRSSPIMGPYLLVCTERSNRKRVRTKIDNKLLILRVDSAGYPGVFLIYLIVFSAKSSSWRWRKLCCLPYVVIFEITFICILIAACALSIYVIHINSEDINSR